MALGLSEGILIAKGERAPLVICQSLLVTLLIKRKSWVHWTAHPLWICHSEIRESSRVSTAEMFSTSQVTASAPDRANFSKDLSLSLQYAIDHAKKLRNVNADSGIAGSHEHPPAIFERAGFPNSDRDTRELRQPLRKPNNDRALFYTIPVSCLIKLR